MSFFRLKFQFYIWCVKEITRDIGVVSYAKISILWMVCHNNFSITACPISYLAVNLKLNGSLFPIREPVVYNSSQQQPPHTSWRTQHHAAP